MTIDYGFESTDEVEFDKQGLPVGTYKAMIIGEEPDTQGRGVVAEFEVVEGEHKGRTGKVWYLTMHDNATTANIAKQNLKRIAEATGKAVSPAFPLKGRVLTLIVDTQKKNPDYTEVKRYLSENHVSDNLPF